MKLSTMMEKPVLQKGKPQARGKCWKGQRGILKECQIQFSFPDPENFQV
jgi:hypothetical protein